MIDPERTEKVNQPLYASVLLLCGLCASGKSTLASYLLQQVGCNRRDQTSRCCGQGEGEILRPCCCLDCYDQAYLIDYDDITENILRRLVKAEEQQGQKNSYNISIAEDGCFDQLHLQAWKEARKVAMDQLHHLLSPQVGDSNLDLRSAVSRSEKQDQMDQEKHTCHSKRILIVLDDNFHLRSMRRDVYRQCQTHVHVRDTTSFSKGESAAISDSILSANNTGGFMSPVIGFSVVVIDTPPPVCKERNAKRRGRARVPDAVMDNMISSMEFPYDMKSSLRIQLRKDVHNFITKELKQQINDLLQRSLQNPIAPLYPPDRDDILERQREEDRRKTLHNRLHRVDRLLRQLVGVVCHVDKIYANRANQSRKKLLDGYRCTHKAMSSTGNAEDEEDRESFQKELAENEDICKRFVQSTFADGCHSLAPDGVKSTSIVEAKVQDAVVTNGLLFFV